MELHSTCIMVNKDKASHGMDKKAVVNHEMLFGHDSLLGDLLHGG